MNVLDDWVDVIQDSSIVAETPTREAGAIAGLIDRVTRSGLNTLSPCTTMALAELAIVAGLIDHSIVKCGLKVARDRGDSPKAVSLQAAIEEA